MLINCAGIQFVMPIEKYPEKVWRKMMDINLTTPFLFTKELLPFMRKNKWGRIVNIASTHGLIGSANKSAYTASKHGLVGLTKVTALETAEDPITCNSLCPGFVLTELIQDQIKAVAKNKNIPFLYYNNNIFIKPIIIFNSIVICINDIFFTSKSTHK